MDLLKFILKLIKLKYYIEIILNLALSDCHCTGNGAGLNPQAVLRVIA